MRLILIRHGTSDHTAEVDRGLTLDGRDQAARLASRLRETGGLGDCRTIFCSPARRALETSDILADCLAAELVVDARLREMNDRTPSGCLEAPTESFAAFVGRVDSFLEQVSRATEAEVVVAVTHAGVIVAALVSLLGMRDDQTRARLEPDNGGVTELDHSGGAWTVRRYNWS